MIKRSLSRNLSKLRQWELPPNEVKQEKKTLKTLKEGINNTADTKEGMDGQTFEED